MAHTVVTGGTGGLGLGVVRVLTEAGVTPTVTWVEEEERRRAESAFGAKVDLRKLDVGDAAAVEQFVEEVRADDGLGALVHLVGGYLDGAPVGGMDLGCWDRQIELNLRYAAVMLRAALPAMRAGRSGRAVVVSSRAALQPFAGAGAYAASKAGLLAMVAAAAAEERDHGITVNAVLPSVIDTPGNRAAMPDADHDRWVRPDEIGHVIRFLISDEASGVTGAAIPVYGRL